MQEPIDYIFFLWREIRQEVRLEHHAFLLLFFFSAFKVDFREVVGVKEFVYIAFVVMLINV